MAVQHGEKYGVIALPSVSLGENFPDRIELAGDLWTATELPLGIPEL